MRFQLDLDNQGEALVDRLEQRTGVRTHRELFNNALTLLDWATAQAYQGRTVASVDRHARESKELVMPVLRYAAAVGQTERSVVATDTTQATKPDAATTAARAAAAATGTPLRLSGKSS